MSGRLARPPPRSPRGGVWPSVRSRRRRGLVRTREPGRAELVVLASDGRGVADLPQPALGRGGAQESSRSASFLTLYSPRICLTISSESEITLSSSTPSSTAFSSPATQPAVLGDVVRRDADRLSVRGETNPLVVLEHGRRRAGPGLRAAPPSRPGARPRPSQRVQRSVDGGNATSSSRRDARSSSGLDSRPSSDCSVKTTSTRWARLRAALRPHPADAAGARAGRRARNVPVPVRVPGPARARSRRSAADAPKTASRVASSAFLWHEPDGVTTTRRCRSGRAGACRSSRRRPTSTP